MSKTGQIKVKALGNRHRVALCMLLACLFGCGVSSDESMTRNAAFPKGKASAEACDPAISKDGKPTLKEQDCPDPTIDLKALSSTKFDRFLEAGTAEKIYSGAGDPYPTVFLPDRPGLVDMGLSEQPDVVVTAFGDSYASGEGAPASNHTRYGDGDLSLSDPRWPAQLARYEDPLWGPGYCHRSPRSTFAKAMEQMARNSFRGVRLAWRSFACSGAVASNLVSETQIISGRTPFMGSNVTRWTHPPQFQVAQDWLTSIDAQSSVVYMNIGGNDAGFSDAIALCATSWSCEDRYAEDIALFHDAARNLVPSLLVNIDDALTSSEWFSGGADDREGSVVYTVVPNIAFAEGQACGEDHDPGRRMQSFPEDELASAEVDYLWRQIGIPLQNSMRTTAEENGWSVVEVDWEDHGICSTTPYINNNVVGVDTQGADMRTWPDLSMGNWHPNNAGYQNWALALEPALAAAIEEQLPADTEIPTVVLDGSDLMFSYSITSLNDGGISSYVQRSLNLLRLEVVCQNGRSYSQRYDYVFNPQGSSESGEVVKVRPCGDLEIGEVSISQSNCFLGKMRWCGKEAVGSADQQVNPLLRDEDFNDGQPQVRLDN